jgi:hypothetical protein
MVKVTINKTGLSVIVMIILMIVVIALAFLIHPQTQETLSVGSYTAILENGTTPVYLSVTNDTCALFYNNNMITHVYGSIKYILPANTSFPVNVFKSFPTFVSYSVLGSNITCTRSIEINDSYYYLFPYAYNYSKIKLT